MMFPRTMMRAEQVALVDLKEVVTTMMVQHHFVETAASYLNNNQSIG
jgi:hypothetical protein